ncbi:hypothetical protein [Thermodesulfovibrio yellowstonii]|uniref:hypothetical protein n=1 Tax=Thermodesulfovibrio TaxID=28261 RepID=UPI0024B393DC|nr:hypothetical protein [Thermodesulfovibrio yellowstonii]MDI6864636.1 hypothetical protein [Thermodesulfovibrio yellowstonii]
MSRKSRIKPHFFGLRRLDYERLRELGLNNASINILRYNPARFFAEFSRYTKNVADEHKAELYMLCFQIATQPDRNRIESIIYVKKPRKEVKAA